MAKRTLEEVGLGFNVKEDQTRLESYRQQARDLMADYLMLTAKRIRNTGIEGFDGYDLGEFADSIGFALLRAYHEGLKVSKAPEVGATLGTVAQNVVNAANREQVKPEGVCASYGCAVKCGSNRFCMTHTKGGRKGPPSK